MIGKALYAWATSQGDLTALIGTRFYPLQAPPDAAYPYVTYFVVSDRTIRSRSGPSGLAYQRVQLNILGATYAQADAVANAIIGGPDGRKLDGFSGTVGGVVVREIALDERRDSYLPSELGESLGPVEIQLDLLCVFDKRV